MRGDSGVFLTAQYSEGRGFCPHPSRPRPTSRSARRGPCTVCPRLPACDGSEDPRTKGARKRQGPAPHMRWSTHQHRRLRRRLEHLSTMAKTRAQVQSEREEREVRSKVGAHDRDVARALRGANARSRRAVAAVLAEQRDASRQADTLGLIRCSWSRPPSAHVLWAAHNVARAGAWSYRHAKHDARGVDRGPAGRDDDTQAPFHFRLNQTHFPGAAVAHQRYIERPKACISSFGTLAESQSERLRPWKEIGERTHVKAGSLRVRCEDEPGLTSEIIRAIPRWVDDDVMTPAAGRTVAVKAREVLQQASGVQGPPEERSDAATEHAIAEAQRREDASGWRAGKHSRRRKGRRRARPRAVDARQRQATRSARAGQRVDTRGRAPIRRYHAHGRTFRQASQRKLKGQRRAQAWPCAVLSGGIAPFSASQRHVRRGARCRHGLPDARHARLFHRRMEARSARQLHRMVATSARVKPLPRRRQSATLRCQLHAV